MQYKTTYWFIDRTRLLLFTIIPALLPLGAMAFYRWLPWWAMAFFCFTKGMVAWTFFEYCFRRWASAGLKRSVSMMVFRMLRYAGRVKWISPLGMMLCAALVPAATQRGMHTTTYALGFLAGAHLCALFVAWMGQAAAKESAMLPGNWQQPDASSKPVQYGITSSFWDKAFGTISKGRHEPDVVIANAPNDMEAATIPQTLAR